MQKFQTEFEKDKVRYEEEKKLYTQRGGDEQWKIVRQTLPNKFPPRSAYNMYVKEKFAEVRSVNGTTPQQTIKVYT